MFRLVLVWIEIGLAIAAIVLLLALIPTLLRDMRAKPDSFAIERRDDSTVFVTATDFTIDTDGRLIFYLRRKKVAAYNTDWKRTQRGLSAGDLED